MNKTEYIEKLRALLDGCPKEEAERFLAYYSEMIDDLVENGCSEQEACQSLGSIEEVAEQIRSGILFPEELSGEELSASDDFSEKTGDDSGKKEKPEAKGTMAEDPSQAKDPDKKSVNVLLIVLAIIGFPLWFPLCIAAFSILLSVFICLWSVVLSFWCIFAAMSAAAAAAIPSSIILAVVGMGIGSFLIQFGSAFIFAALAIVFLLLSVLVTKGIAKLTAFVFKGLWRALVKK